jgi:hypothetical protein
MYLPYLRGRQYELLALRELVDTRRIGKNVIPLIEPVKSSSTLIKTLKTFIQNEKELGVIHNPQIGAFNKDTKGEKGNGFSEEYEELLENKLIIKAHVLNKKSKFEIKMLETQGFSKKDLLIINNNRDYINLFAEEFSVVHPRYTFIPDESVFRRKIRKRRVLLDDRFEKQRRNVDYATINDEPFSDDHLFYREDGFSGFSDYSIVGDHFFESGFAPHAVVLHIVYFAEDRSLRIKHFVSDSNDDITNPAGKFYEALKKLKDWNNVGSMDTLGLRVLLEHFENETYPGLGIVKKLTMMHHIELVGQYLDEVKTK